MKKGYNRKRIGNVAIPLTLIASFALLPGVVTEYGLSVAIVGFFYVLLASSWSIVAGLAGQISFAHAGFASVGAYCSAALSLQLGVPPCLAVVIASLVAGLLGWVLGAFTLPLAGLYLSLSTLCFSEVVRLLLIRQERWTRGTMGLKVPALLSEYSKAHYYYVFLLVAIVVLFAIHGLIKSDAGLSMRAVGDDEQAAGTLGVATARARLLAFAVSSAIAGLAGALYGHYSAIITPDDIGSLEQMFLVLAMATIGGLRTFWGPVLGAFLLHVLSESVRVTGACRFLVFGIVALGIVRFAPRGLAGLLDRRKA